MGNACDRRKNAVDPHPMDDCEGPWSIDQAFEICDESEEHVFRDKVMLLSDSEASTRATAVHLLNQGAISCPEGFCMVHAISRGTYFLLYRQGEKQAALDCLEVDEESLALRSKKKSLRADQYLIRIEKKAEERLGVDVVANNDSLSIESVSDEGVISSWNETNATDPKVQVKRGDRIIEVNGIKGSADDIITECGKANVMVMVLHRGKITSSSTARPPAGPDVSSTAKTASDQSEGVHQITFDMTEGTTFEEYSIVLEKATHSTLGVDVVQTQDDMAMVIDKITGGLVGAWNEDNPDRQVMRGDTIVEVNGSRGCGAMIKRIKEETRLEVTLRRGIVEEARGVDAKEDVTVGITPTGSEGGDKEGRETSSNTTRTPASAEGHGTEEDTGATQQCLEVRDEEAVLEDAA